MLFFWPKLLSPFLSSTVFPLSLFSVGWLCGARVFVLIGVNCSLPALHCRLFVIIIIIGCMLLLRT